MPIPNSMGIVPPVVGTTAGPTWANDLNNILTNQVADHNHTGTPNGGQLSQAALNITGDLSLNNNGLTAAQRVALATQASSPGAQSLWSGGGNLYWTPSAGSAVQITNGSAINVSAFGGISGLPFGTAGASYNSTGFFKWNKTTTAYADMYAGRLRLYDAAAAAPTNAVILSSPTSVAANITFTLPGTLPVSSSNLQVSPAGTISYATFNTASANTINTGWSSSGTILATTTLTSSQGRPLRISLEDIQGGPSAYIVLKNNAAGGTQNSPINASIYYRVNSDLTTKTAGYIFRAYDPIVFSDSSGGVRLPASLSWVYTPAPGETTFTIDLIGLNTSRAPATDYTINVFEGRLVVYEL